MKNTRSAALLAMAAMAGLGAGIQPTPAQTTPERSASSQTAQSKQAQADRIRAVQEARSIKAVFGGGYRIRNRSPRPPGPGWTHAHVQRMARKAKNRQRNKQAHR